MDDFYIDEKGLAAYFEIHWLDKLREFDITDTLESKSKVVPDSFVSSDYSLAVAHFIKQTLKEKSISPQNVLEIGPALGRNTYELVQAIPSIDSVTIVEPSQRFLTNLKNILIDGTGCEFSYIRSLNELRSFRFNTDRITEDCKHVNFNLLGEAFDLNVVDRKHDLTVCLNVLDQCESPSKIVNALKDATDNTGVVILSCSYQWNKKHLKIQSEALDDINEYFDDKWLKLAEDDHEYRIRINERHSLLFLTHIVAYQRC